MSQRTMQEPPAGDFLSGEAELEYAHQQMWGSYWTGARVMVASWVMAFGAFLFAFFYLRSLNSNGLWYLKNERPPLLIGAFVLSLIVVSAAVFSISSRRLRRSAAALDWIVGSSVAFLLGLLGVGLQAWEMGRLPFLPGGTGYASVFVGWQIVMILTLCGGLYWLETLVARALRVRRLLRPLPISAQDPDVTMFRGSLDGFMLFWNFMALTEVLVFILFYVVH